MLDTSNLPKFLKGITDAIRAKKGTTEPIKHALIDEEIASIESGNPYEKLQELVLHPSRTDYTAVFSKSCLTDDDLMQIKLDTSKGTTFSAMFQYCSNLTTVPQLDTSNGTSFQFTFSFCSNLTTIPQLDTTNGKYFTGMFSNCKNLTTIPQLDLSNGTNLSGMFATCYSLKNVSFVQNCINKSISFSNSDKLTDESIQSIIDGLNTVKTTQTLTLHADVKARLTEEQIATIYEKGWTLA